MSDWNAKVIAKFRANNGKVGGSFETMRLLLLHSVGARSGEPRINPLTTIEDRDRHVIIASKGGADTHPDWYYNVVAHPDVQVELGKEKFSARAEVAAEPERNELFRKMSSLYPGFLEYERKTDRVIPVITLTRVS